MGDISFLVIVVGIIIIGPLSPVAYGLYWLLGSLFILIVLGKSLGSFVRVLDHASNATIIVGAFLVPLIIVGSILILG